jgi:thiol-disulfide isomerase/thioredoxin
MKSSNSSFALLIFSFMLLFSCAKSQNEPLQKDEPVDKTIQYDKTNRPLLLEFTSTGCPGCGSWGKPTFYQLAQEYGDEINALAIHIKYGDPMITAQSNLIAGNRYGQNYTPQIWVNDTNIVVIQGGINSAASIARAKEVIAINKKNTVPALGGILTKTSANNWHIQFGVQAQNEPIDESYHLACYLLESQIVHQQSGYANNPAQHNYVLRKSIGEVFGYSTAELQAQNTNTYALAAEFVLDENIKPENSHVLLVLWQKQGNRFVATNSLRID